VIYVPQLSPETADHLLVEAVRRCVLPASHLPMVIEAWEHPRHEAFAPRTAWSPHNAFTEVDKSPSLRVQMESGSGSPVPSGARSRSDAF
jgi:hypothetical protein